MSSKSSFDMLLIVVESFEPEDTSSGCEELAIKVGDVVNVMVKSPNGWWFVENDDQHGWVPGTYLEPKVGIQN